MLDPFENPTWAPAECSTWNSLLQSSGWERIPNKPPSVRRCLQCSPQECFCEKRVSRYFQQCSNLPFTFASPRLKSLYWCTWWCHFFDICLIFVWYFFDICLIFVWYLSAICLIFVWYLYNICMISDSRHCTSALANVTSFTKCKCKQIAFECGPHNWEHI